MTKLALFVRLEAKPGQEAALAEFLASALPLANEESGTTCQRRVKTDPFLLKNADPKLTP